MRRSSSHLRTFTLLIFSLLFADTAISQVIIRERVEIKPRTPLAAVQAVTPSLTITYQWRSSAAGRIEVTGPCGYTANAEAPGNGPGQLATVQLVISPAPVGSYQLVLNTVPPNASDLCGELFSVVNHNGQTVQSGNSGPFSCRMNPPGPLFFSYTTGFNIGVNFPRVFVDSYSDSFGFSPRADECSTQIATANDPMQMRIVQGAEYGQFYRVTVTEETPLGDEVTMSPNEIASVLSFKVDGDEPPAEGAIVLIEGTSNGVTSIAELEIVWEDPVFYEVLPAVLELAVGEATAVRAKAYNFFNLEIRIPSGREILISAGPETGGGGIPVKIADTPQVGSSVVSLKKSINQQVEAVYGSFITASGDTVANEVVVLWSQLRDGLIKYLANGTVLTENEETIVGIEILDLELGLSGGANVTVAGAMLTLRILDEEPTELWPYLPDQNNGDSRGADRPGYDSDRPITIELIDGNGNPVAGKAIKFESEIVSAEGHLHPTTSLPKIEQGLFHKGSPKGNPFTVSTNTAGKVEIDRYLASQVSGLFKITASLVEDANVKDELEITVQVPGLVDFSQIQTDIWNLTGEVSGLHIDNHWCTPKMLDSLTAAVVDFYSWSGSTAGGGQFIVLDINDMSLPWGGAFDNNGVWNFNSDHSFHRVGLSVDIERVPGNLRLNDGTLTRTGRKLHDYMVRYGGRKYPEKNIHYGFDGGN